MPENETSGTCRAGRKKKICKHASSLLITSQVLLNTFKISCFHAQPISLLGLTNNDVTLILLTAR